MANTDNLDDMDPETLAAVLKGIDEVERELEKFRKDMEATFGEVNSALSRVETAVAELALVARRRTTKSRHTLDDIPGDSAAEKLVNLLKQMYPQYCEPKQP